MNSNPAMRFKPALTNDDLTVIQDRSVDSPDVHLLLWEVARLRTAYPPECASLRLYCLTAQWFRLPK
jgi:hypothetical protein